MEEETESKNRGEEEEEKRETGSRNSVIVICSITNCRERGMGMILLTNRRNSGFYVYASMLRNLEEREEGEGERKVASDNELNFSSKSSMLSNNLTLCRCSFLKVE
nr:uncharacterized protein LOC112020043 [Quercus suber]